MYYAGNLLNRSTNAAATWSTISPDLTGGPSPNGSYPFGTITTVAAAQTDGSVLYVGTDDGRVWTTRDLGASWTQLTDPQFPASWVPRGRPTELRVANEQRREVLGGPHRRLAARAGERPHPRRCRPGGR